ncbi:MAG: undecaprenyl-diphosphate phosphatase [Jatrophihabitans sp.]
MSGHLSWLEASVVGMMQGVAELFPVSSLGHSVLLPAIIGGSWQHDLDVRSPESPYLAFIVGLHVATAIALIIYFWRDWVRIVRGLVTSIRHRRIRSSDERLAWLLVLATIPVGLSGLLLEHAFRTTLARPTPTALFLVLNGLVLLLADHRRRRHERQAIPAAAGAAVTEPAGAEQSDARLARLSVRRAVLIGAAQVAALAPGISRSGITMAAGLRGGLDNEDAARFSFLLATPVILAAGALKLPDLSGPLGDGIRGQVLLGSVLSGVGAYLSVRFLSRYFRSHSLRPFAVYCLIAGTAAVVLVNR